MDLKHPTVGTSDTEAIIVRADEVDEAGADISTISPQTASDESDFNDRIESRRAQDAQSIGSPKILANAVPSPPRPVPRPVLRREGSTPAPPQQPPPPAPPPQREESGNPTDSLSLQQLRKLVSDFPKAEPTAYAYEYEETRSFPEELEEWFQYTEEETYMLLRAKQTFLEEWERVKAEAPSSADQALDWSDAGEQNKASFATGFVQELTNPDLPTRVKALDCISYIVLGAWNDSAGIEKDDAVVDVVPSIAKWFESQATKPRWQLKCIFDDTKMMSTLGVAQKLIELLRKIWDFEQSVSR